MGLAKKQDSIGLRINSEHKEIIRMAAEFTGQDLTSYLVSTALEKAKKDIMEHKEMQALLMSSRDFEKIERAIDKPRAANEKLKKAFKKHAEKFEEQAIETFIHLSELLSLESTDKATYRKNFDCEEPSLNDYIQKYAKQNSRDDVSQTHVLFDHENKRIISYYSTCNYAIQKSSLKSRFGFPTPQIPATLIGRLAVDNNYKSKGYGGVTLAEALKQIRAISKITGIKIVLVDALNESAVNFDELADDKMKLFMTVADIESTYAQFNYPTKH